MFTSEFVQAESQNVQDSAKNRFSNKILVIEDCNKLLLDIHPDQKETEAEYRVIANLLKTEPYISKVRRTEFIKEKYALQNRPACKIVSYDQNYLSTDQVPYLNGSTILAPQYSPYSYLATQAPKDNTVSDHFKVMLDKNSITLVTLVMPKEPKKNGLGQIELLDRCIPFWERESIRIDNDHELKPVQGPIKEITFEGSKQKIVIRELNIIQNGVLKTVITHYHYEDWPDFSTPDLPVFKEFFKIVYQKICEDRLNEKKETPPTIHCHAGCGRTGVLIACCVIMDYIQEQTMLGRELNDISFNIPELVLEMKSCREMIKNPEQANFVKEWLEDHVRDLGCRCGVIA